MADTTAPTKSLAVPLTAFAVGAVVAVLVGVFGKIHDPTLQGTTTLGFRTVIDMKVVLATVVGVLAVLQIVGGLWIYGRLGRPAPAWVGTAHRISGAIAVILAVFVAYSCLWALGLESGTLKDGEPVGTRTVVHGVLGCAVMGAFVVKAAAVRSRPPISMPATVVPRGTLPLAPAYAATQPPSTSASTTRRTRITASPPSASWPMPRRLVDLTRSL